MRKPIYALLGFGLLCLCNHAVPAKDWPQWGGTAARNNVATGHSIPTEWNCGKVHRRTGEWDRSEASNIKWTAELGSQSFGSPVVADGRIFVGTNNEAGYLERAKGDYGCLLCFRESDGKFLWQYSSEKLASGRVHDWPLQGIVSSPLVTDDRMWFVNNRGEVVCADTHGFHDGEDDGPITGVRARLFTVATGFRDESQPGYYGSAGRLLRAIAGQADIPMPSYFSIRKEGPGRITILSRVNKTYVPQFTVDYRGTRIRLITAEDSDGSLVGRRSCLR